MGGTSTAATEARLSEEDVVKVLTSLGSAIHALKHLYSAYDGAEHGAAIVLSVLFRCGPSRPSDIAHSCGLDLSTVSRHARSLEEAGHVARAADPSDRRAHRLALTDEGIEHVQGLWRLRIDRMGEHIGHWSHQDVETLAAIAERFATDLGQEPLGLPDPDDVRAAHQSALSTTTPPKGA